MPKIPPHLQKKRKTKLTYSNHLLNWKACTLCSLQETRAKVVLFSGSIPCDVLFVGEAPGVSEDVIGRPFVGPAGKLLHRIIGVADPDYLKLAYTNLIACIPLDETGTKVSEPPKKAIAACKPRLKEILSLCKPKAVVAVGKIPHKHIQTLVDFEVRRVTAIIHPAAILRMDISQKGLATQRTTIILSDLFNDLTE